MAASVHCGAETPPPRRCGRDGQCGGSRACHPGLWGPGAKVASRESGLGSCVYIRCTTGTDIHTCVGVLGCAPARTCSRGPPARPGRSCRLRGPSGRMAGAPGLREGAAPQPPGQAHRSRRPVLPSSPARGVQACSHLPASPDPAPASSQLPRPAHPSFHLAPHPPGLSVGWWAELRSGSWIPFPGDPRPLGSQRAHPERVWGEGVQGGELLARGLS